MKQILIRHTEDITPDEAFARAYRAWQASGEVKTGIVVFHDKIIVEFSDCSKHPSMTVFRKRRRESNESR